MYFSLIGAPMFFILIASIIGFLVGIVKKNKRLYKTSFDNFIGGHFNLYNCTFNFK